MPASEIIDCPECKGITAQVCVKRQRATIHNGGSQKFSEYSFCAEDCQFGKAIAAKYPNITGHRRPHHKPAVRHRAANRSICQQPGCQKEARTKGLCPNHYSQRNRRERAEAGRARLCMVEGCTRPHAAKGYCNMHYLTKYHSNKKGDAA